MLENPLEPRHPSGVFLRCSCTKATRALDTLVNLLARRANFGQPSGLNNFTRFESIAFEEGLNLLSSREVWTSYLDAMPEPESCGDFALS